MTDKIDGVEDTKEVEPKEPDNKKEPTYTEDEQRAISLGWKPKEEWQGSETDWVPAKWWLKYGDLEQRSQLLETDSKKKDKVINAMKEHYVRVKDDAKAELIDTLRRAKKEAVAAEDFEKAANIDAQLEDMQTKLEVKFAKRDAQVEQDAAVPQGPPKEFFDWNKLNPWYKYGNSDDAMTVAADSIAINIARTQPTLPYEKILALTESKIKEAFPEKFKEDKPLSLVDDSNQRSRGASAGKRSKYQLDEAQKAAAKHFGMTEEEYAKDLEAYDKRKGFI